MRQPGFECTPLLIEIHFALNGGNYMQKSIAFFGQCFQRVGGFGRLIGVDSPYTASMSTLTELFSGQMRGFIAFPPNPRVAGSDSRFGWGTRRYGNSGRTRRKA